MEGAWVFMTSRSCTATVQGKDPSIAMVLSTNNVGLRKNTPVKKASSVQRALDVEYWSSVSVEVGGQQPQIPERQRSGDGLTHGLSLPTNYIASITGLYFRSSFTLCFA